MAPVSAAGAAAKPAGARSIMSRSPITTRRSSPAWCATSMVRCSSAPAAWVTESVNKEAVAKLPPELWRRIQVWRSTDNGRSWEQVVARDGLRPWSPVVLNTITAGQPFVAGNLWSDQTHGKNGKVLHMAWRRSKLVLWPLNAARTDVEAPVSILDGEATLGPCPSEMSWYLDHPIGSVLRLADGRWHSLLFFRAGDIDEVISDAMPTPHTGTWIEEVLDEGEARPGWGF